MNKKVIIIAEAGVNHNGDLTIAKKLIDAAADAGADFVKFQTFKADKIVTQNAQKAEYQVRNTKDGDNSQYNMLKKLEMPDDWHQFLIEYAKSKGIQFLSTAFDNDSIDFLDNLGITIFKIPSGEITNKPYLKKIAQKKKPIILSTGMSDLSEIKQAIEVLINEGADQDSITILHCTTEYPTPMLEVNLLAMNSIKAQLGFEVGYSDHTLGIEVPIAAVALGASIIEKHFTLDKSMPGPDHLASLDPSELKKMVTAIRNIEAAISGSGNKELSVSEAKNIAIARKSLFFKHSLKAGHVIGQDDLIALRPGTGLSPMESDNIVGRILTVDVLKNDFVQFNQLE
ncbi:MAG: N-acetylneuraminate synthase [Sphingobacteriales bacterium 17-39-43]|uniref:N-acetylneuraminate synthase n=1 Tax=Daejeonella sp. TaxID=2805397 RepID=UPI000BDC6CD3|nr:N-acetylneuraminate synthase [Daejeonella sp.]OYZ30200.1 MAG: N-acetylneuraminate synthase [Sphingobacteriales bacterium 16-39-50]OZA22943.1 MAG: N-acetylneuraminate synthase [Sphingobacteriales bacterium 17-39-43]HQT24163.1 N-acetylneuraminate synthase [Daejeonella sp.]HQT58773.1 N-acetylneuraminate synthase [Daejeonella sp.]